MNPNAPASLFGGLHVLADDDLRWNRDPVEQAEAACAGGASVIQLRVKQAGDAAFLDWGRKIRVLSRQRGIAFVVNDRFDIALAAEADGVHLGQDDLPSSALPNEARARLAIGRSTHSLDQARDALAEPLSYLAFGPVFGTTSKVSPYDPRGLEDLSRVVEMAAPLPVVAIGGVDAERAPAVIAAGAAGIAVISAVASAADPVGATRALSACFRCGRADRAG